jgi:hypothetical protein
MGKFFLEVVQDSNGLYCANMQVDGVPVENLSKDVDYNTLKTSILRKTGIVILDRKNMKFSQYKRKKYAYIDNTQPLPDCRVMLSAVINGHKPNF